MYDYIGYLKVFLDSQDHLGDVQSQRHQGVGQDQGLPLIVNFWKICINKGCSGWSWWPFHGDLCFGSMLPMDYLGAFGTFRNARKASGAQRCEFAKIFSFMTNWSDALKVLVSFHLLAWLGWCLWLEGKGLSHCAQTDWLVQCWKGFPYIAELAETPL